MGRVHFVEIGDQPWCPRALRDATTDLLELCFRTWRYYAPIVPRLTAALERTGDRDIVDLCSGGGGPWPTLLADLDGGPPIRVLLTDKYPNTSGAARVEGASDGRIRRDPRSIDATAVPRDLRGFRTMFSSFHHFRPAAARAILADAVRDRVGIGVFEFTGRSPLRFLLAAVAPFAVLYAVPFLRPVRWRTLVFTYLIPIVPLGVLIDGIASCMRTYSVAELEALVAPLRGDGYTWEVGEARGARRRPRITYVIGCPTLAAASSTGADQRRPARPADRPGTARAAGLQSRR